jgi:hypothetical protein
MRQQRMEDDTCPAISKLCCSADRSAGAINSTCEVTKETTGQTKVRGRDGEIKVYQESQLFLAECLMHG